MAIEKCINEFDVNDVIFEEGSTGRELFVVLDGQVEIAKVNGTEQDRHRDARQGRVLRRDGRDRRLVAFGDRHRRRASHPRDADQPRPLRLSGQPAAGVRADDHGCAQQAPARLERRHLQKRGQPSGQSMSDRQPIPFKTLLDSDVCYADPGGGRRLPDPLQESRGERLSGARQLAHHHDRRRAVDELSASRAPASTMSA